MRQNALTSRVACAAMELLESASRISWNAAAGSSIGNPQGGVIKARHLQANLGTSACRGNLCSFEGSRILRFEAYRLPRQQASCSTQNPACRHLLYPVRESYRLGNLRLCQTFFFRLRDVILNTGLAVASYRCTQCHKFALPRSQMRHGLLRCSYAATDAADSSCFNFAMILSPTCRATALRSSSGTSSMRQMSVYF